MTITKQNILDSYNSVYSADNNKDKIYSELTTQEKIEALLIYLIINPSSSSNIDLTSVTNKLPSVLINDRIKVDNSGVIQPISATTLPLPTGAATAANQTTSNASLSSIDSKVTPLTANITSIATDGTSGDKTILIPTTGKALRISSVYIQMASNVAITLKKNTTTISGAMTVNTAALDFVPPIGFSSNENFVINVGSAVAVNGFVTWWEV